MKSNLFSYSRQKNGRFVNLYKVITNQFATIPNPIKDNSDSSPYLATSWLSRANQNYLRTDSISHTRTRTKFLQDTDSSSIEQNNTEDTLNRMYLNQIIKRETPKIANDYSETDFYSVGNTLKKEKTMTTIQCKRKQLPTISSSLYKKKLNMTLKGRCKSTNKRITIRANYPKKLECSYEVDDERSLPPVVLVLILPHIIGRK